jgi:hypothetical protein
MNKSLIFSLLIAIVFALSISADRNVRANRNAKNLNLAGPGNAAAREKRSATPERLSATGVQANVKSNNVRARNVKASNVKAANLKGGYGYGYDSYCDPYDPYCDSYSYESYSYCDPYYDSYCDSYEYGYYKK